MMHVTAFHGFDRGTLTVRLALQCHCLYRCRMSQSEQLNIWKGSEQELSLEVRICCSPLHPQKREGAYKGLVPHSPPLDAFQ
jgi:hypothetical protein